MHTYPCTWLHLIYSTALGDYGALTDFPLGPFSNEVRELSFNVSIEDDVIPEENKVFTATLTLLPDDQARFRNLVIVAPDIATVTIVDDGKYPAHLLCCKTLLREVL